MPESKMPTSTNRFMRGTMPVGPGVPSGEITLSTSPGPTASWRASSCPITMPGSSTVPPPSSAGSVIDWGRPSSARLPLFKWRPTSITAVAWAGSIPGTPTPRRLTLGPLAHVAEHVLPVAQSAAEAGQGDVRIETEDLLAQLVLEAGHDREHDEQRRHADRHPRQRERGDQREKRPPPVSQVPHPDCQLPAHGRLSGRSGGKRRPARRADTPASSITSRSMPTPSPAVGGRPYSSAR